MPDSFGKPSVSGIRRFFNVLKAVFLTQIYMNILILVVIVAISIAGFKFIGSNEKNETPTGMAVLEDAQPLESACEEKECEQDCSLCPVETNVETQNVIYYKCPAGALVKDLDECLDSLPEDSGEYTGTVEGVTLSIDNIEYEKEKDDTGYVTRVDYTITNRGEKPIVPKIEIKVYAEWGSKILGKEPSKVIDPEIVVNPNDYVSRKETMRIYFEGKKQTLRLRLINTLANPDKDVLILTRDFELG